MSLADDLRALALLLQAHADRMAARARARPACTRDTCQVPECGDLSTDVAWFLWRPCAEHTRLTARWGRRPDDARCARELLEHVHRCPAHGHVHLCADHWTAHVFAREGEPLRFGLDDHGLLVAPAALAWLEWDNTPDAREAPDG